MFGVLHPYSAMKESGAPWLGSVPKHWTILPNRALFAEVKDRDHPDEEMLSVTITRGVIKQKALLSDSAKKDSSNLDRTAYKLVQPRDIAYNKMRAWQGAIGVSEYRGIVSPAYVVLRLRVAANPRYFHYLYRTPQFAKEAERWSYGITSDMWSLRPEHFRLITCLLPPPDEQTAIVRFLNDADSRFRKSILAKQRMIGLLEEQKQALIHRAVTRGFVERLPLNILGLPQQAGPVNGWKSIPVAQLIQKRWLVIQDGNHGELHPTTSEYVEDGIPFLMAKDVRSTNLDFAGCAKITEERALQLRIGFSLPGDVLLTHKASIGQIGRVPKELSWPFVMLTPQVTYYRLLTDQIASDYLFLFMHSRTFQEQLEVLSLNQSTRPYLGLIEQRHLIICYPSLEEQNRITNTCSADVRSLDAAIRNTSHQIRLLRDYQTSLVADVVTGKLDVRDAAAKLSDDLPETTLLEATDTLNVDDATGIEAAVETVPEEAEA